MSDVGLDVTRWPVAEPPIQLADGVECRSDGAFVALLATARDGTLLHVDFAAGESAALYGVAQRTLMDALKREPTS